MNQSGYHSKDVIPTRHWPSAVPFLRARLKNRENPVFKPALVLLLALVSVVGVAGGSPATAADTLAGSFPPVSATPANTHRSPRERTEAIRSLREGAAPGWRRAALEQFTFGSTPPAAVSPSETSRPADTSALVQEAVTILGLEELWFESWKPTATITAALLDPDQNRSVELDESGIFRVRDLADGHELFRLPSTTPLDRDLAGLDPNGRWIASLDSTAAWRLRRIPGPDSIAGDSVKSGNPAWISFHPEQSRVAIGGSDASSPELWIGPLPLQGMTGVRRITLPAIPLRFAWSPSGTRLAVLCKGLSAVVVIDPAVEREVGRLELPEPPADFAWMPDARRILVASSSGVSIGDTQDQSVIAFAGATGGTTAIAVPDNGALMAVAGITGRLEVWDFKAARRITTIPSGPIVGLQWSADATRLVVQPEHSRVPRLAGFSLTRDVVHFVPPGATVLPDSPPGPLLRWDTNGVWLKRSGGLPVKLPANGPISGAAVSPNSEWIHVKTADGVVREWNLARLRQRLAALGLVW